MEPKNRASSKRKREQVLKNYRKKTQTFMVFSSEPDIHPLPSRTNHTRPAGGAGAEKTKNRKEGFKIPFRNSSKWPKAERPAHLQDDQIFNLMSIESVTEQISRWEQTKALQKSNEIKVLKTGGKTFKTNQDIKTMKIEAGEDNATDIFHPQRYKIRPAVVRVDKTWALYPTNWPEIYYSQNLEDVGLEDQFGQKQIELLHDRRSSIEIKMFSPMNVNVGKSEFKTQNLRQLSDGTTDIVAKEEWCSIMTVNDLMMALDNLVAGYAVFWPGDRSMVTIRRAVTKNKEFVEISNQMTRKKLLEAYLNKMLEINQQRATQKSVPLKFKECDTWAKEFIENKTNYVRQEEKPDNENSDIQTIKNLLTQNLLTQNLKVTQEDGGKERISDFQYMKKILVGKKIKNKEVCIYFNLKGGCTATDCSRGHVCAYIPRGEKELCGKDHSKTQHFKRN